MKPDRAQRESKPRTDVFPTVFRAVVLSAAAVFCAACSQNHPGTEAGETVGADEFRIDFSRVNPDGESGSQPTVTVRAFTLEQRIEYETVSAVGSLAPIREYAIRMPFAAVATGVHGGAVDAGDAIVVLDTTELDRDLRGLERELLLQEVNFFQRGGSAVEDGTQGDALGDYLDESRTLLREGFAGGADTAELLRRHIGLTARWLENREFITELQHLETGIRLTLESIAEVAGKIERSRISAPASGVFVPQDLYPGEYYPAGQLIGRFYPTRPRAAEIRVPEREILGIALGMSAHVSIGVPEVAAAVGAVTSISPLKDPVTDSYTVVVELSDVPRSLPFGLPLRAQIRVGGGVPAFTVPFEAVQNDGNRFFLWRIADDTLTRVEIPEPRYSTDGYRVDLSETGLGDGTAIANQYRIVYREGMRVRVQ